MNSLARSWLLPLAVVLGHVPNVHGMPTRDEAIELLQKITGVAMQLRDLSSELNAGNQKEIEAELLQLTEQIRPLVFQKQWSDLGDYMEAGAFSKERMAPLIERGSWGRSSDLLGPQRATDVAKNSRVPSSECFVLALSDRTAVGFHWDGTQLRLAFYIDPEFEKEFRRRGVEKLVEYALKSMTARGPARALAFGNLQHLGAEAKEVVPSVTISLEKLLKHPDPYVRIQSAYTIWTIDSDVGGVPVLIESLKGDDVETRYRALAATFLGLIGANAKPAVPALIAAISESDASLRVAAAVALGRIDGRQRLAREVLIPSLAEEDPNVLRDAAEGLAAIGFDAESVEALHRRLQQNHDKEPWSVFDSHTVTVALRDLLSGDDDHLRKMAGEVLMLMGESTSAARE